MDRFPVIVVDDHCVVREGLAGLIECEPDLTVIAKAATGSAALEYVALAPASIVVLDLDLPDMTGFEVLRQLTDRYPQSRVLVFSSFPTTAFSSRALDAGAAGYLSKQSCSTSVLSALRSMTSAWGSWCDVV